MNGIRAQIEIKSPLGCPVTQVADATGEPVTSITKTYSESADNITEEFIINSDTSLDSVEFSEFSRELTEVFSYDSKRVYRFTRNPHQNCPCDTIESFDCPILDVYTQNDSLIVVFHTPDLDCLKNILNELNDRWEDINVRRLLYSDREKAEQDFVLVDRGALTDRQREVLETAHEMGYFEHPKHANAGDVAHELGVNRSTFTEHLAAAQQKLHTTILEK